MNLVSDIVVCAEHYCTQSSSSCPLTPYTPHPFWQLDSVSTKVNEFAYILLPGKIQHLDTLPLIVPTFIDASAPSQGVSRHLQASSYLVAFANAGCRRPPILRCHRPPDRYVHLTRHTLTLHFPYPFRLSPLHIPPTSHLFSEENHLKNCNNGQAQ
jgi:hypothetical protein